LWNYAYVHCTTSEGACTLTQFLDIDMIFHSTKKLL